MNDLIAHFPLILAVSKAKLLPKDGFCENFAQISSFRYAPAVCGYGAGRKEDCNDLAAEDAGL
jgi:hypothetical protein